MSKRLPVTPAPGPLEEYSQHFDELFSLRNQRESFRRYLEGLLLPSERHKTLTALANTEPVVGAQHARAQGLQWFLSESTWDPKAINARRLEELRADPTTAPDEDGVLVIDEHGDRKWGKQTAHVGRQYLANLGKTDSGVVSVTSLWADERVYWPVDLEPYTPAHHFPQGKADPQFRTKLRLAVELVQRAVERDLPFRAVVADSFYGEDEGFKQGLRELGLGYVLALKPSHSWLHQQGDVGALWQVAEGAGWKDAASPGGWRKVERAFRDGHTEEWWALEVVAGPYGPQKLHRAFVVSTDPEKLPELSTWYLVTNLPAVGSERAGEEGALPAADLEEVVRLYGLRMWVEQSYKQTKHSLGWSQYQVRSDLAIRRHWVLVCCAFSFCWYNQSHSPRDEALPPDSGQPAAPGATDPATEEVAGRGKNQAQGMLAGGAEGGQSLVGPLDNAVALLERLVRQAPATPTTTTA